MRKEASPGGFNRHSCASSCGQALLQHHLSTRSSTRGCPGTQPGRGTLRGPVRGMLQLNSSKNAPCQGHKAEGLKQPGGSGDQAECDPRGRAGWGHRLLGSSEVEAPGGPRCHNISYLLQRTFLPFFFFFFER